MGFGTDVFLVFLVFLFFFPGKSLSLSFENNSKGPKQDSAYAILKLLELYEMSIFTGLAQCSFLIIKACLKIQN